MIGRPRTLPGKRSPRRARWAPKMSNNCRKVVENLLHELRFFPMSSNSSQGRPELTAVGLHFVDVGPHWPMMVNVWQGLATPRTRSARFANLNHDWPKFTQCWPIWVEIGPSLAKAGQFGQSVGQFGPMLVERGSSLGSKSHCSTQATVRQPLDIIGARRVRQDICCSCEETGTATQILNNCRRTCRSELLKRPESPLGCHCKKHKTAPE